MNQRRTGVITEYKLGQYAYERKADSEYNYIWENIAGPTDLG